MSNFGCGDAYKSCSEACGKIPQTGNLNDPDFEKWMKCIDACFDSWADCTIKNLDGILGKLGHAKTTRKKAQIMASMKDFDFLPKDMRSQFKKLSLLLEKSSARKK